MRFPLSHSVLGRDLLLFLEIAVSAKLESLSRERFEERLNPSVQVHLEQEWVICKTSLPQENAKLHSEVMCREGKGTLRAAPHTRHCQPSDLGEAFRSDGRWCGQCCLGDGGCCSRQGGLRWGAIPSLTAASSASGRGQMRPMYSGHCPALEPALLAQLQSSAGFDCLLDCLVYHSL